MSGPSATPLARAAAVVRAHYTRFVQGVCARPMRAALILLLACVPAVVLSVRYFIDIRAGLQELLPPSAPSVRALEQLHARFGGQSHLAVIAQSSDVDANHRFIDALAARLTALHLPEARSIQARVDAERTWAKDRAPLLLAPDKFDGIAHDLDDALRTAKLAANPLYVDLDDTPPKAKWDALDKRIDEETKGKDRFPHGYIESADGHTVVMLIWLEGSEVDFGPSARLLAAAQREVAALRPAYPKSMVVAYNGEVPNMVEEHAAILADLSLSSAIVFLVVALLIAVYFRSPRSVIAVWASLVPGLLWTFALGRLFAGSLNSNTAFLGSIIAGNGINYPLIYLAYYRAQDAEAPQVDAIVRAAVQALPGTLGAAATASAAYAGLAAATFRGFSQFGLLGGVGMLTTWALSFVAMPIAIALFRPPRRIVRRTRIQERFGAFLMKPAAWVVAAVFAGLAVGGGLYGARQAKRGGLYEMDLRALRNRDSLAHGSASWDRKMNEVFGVWLNPVVALVRDPADRERAAAELRRVLVDRPPPVAERVETVARYVPDAPEQQRRLAKLKQIAGELAEVAPADIPEKVRPWIDRWLAPARLQPIALPEVPRTIRQGFTDVHGRADQTVLVYPSLKVNFDDGTNILRFADRLGDAHLPKDTVVGGGFLFMAEIIRVVRDEAPHVVLTVALLVGCVLLVLCRRRPSRAAIAIASVGTIAILAQLIMVALGVRVNMLNFAAVPITIGVGADYVVNLFAAMDALDCDARRACTQMGGAILLCSLTTVVGYASLLVAQSGALRSFGWAAVLGELMAIATVLLVLPHVVRR